MSKTAEHYPCRTMPGAVSIGVGFLADFTQALHIGLRLHPSLWGWLTAAIVVTVGLHKDILGGIASSFGQKPIFGLYRSMAYITFPGRIRFVHYGLATIVTFIISTIPCGSFRRLETCLRIFPHQGFYPSNFMLISSPNSYGIACGE